MTPISSSKSPTFKNAKLKLKQLFCFDVSPLSFWGSCLVSRLIKNKSSVQQSVIEISNILSITKWQCSLWQFNLNWSKTESYTCSAWANSYIQTACLSEQSLKWLSMGVYEKWTWMKMYHQSGNKFIFRNSILNKRRPALGGNRIRAKRK